MKFRVKGTNFRIVNSRRGMLLYACQNIGNPSWWFLGRFDTEAQCRTKARKSARKVLVYVRNKGREDKTWNVSMEVAKAAEQIASVEMPY